MALKAGAYLLKRRCANRHCSLLPAGVLAGNQLVRENLNRACVAQSSKTIYVKSIQGSGGVVHIKPGILQSRVNSKLLP
jgi:hypothetical protein